MHLDMPEGWDETLEPCAECSEEPAFVQVRYGRVVTEPVCRDCAFEMDAWSERTRDYR